MIRSMVAERNVRRVVFHVTQATSSVLKDSTASTQVFDTLAAHGFLVDVTVRDPKRQSPVIEAVIDAKTNRPTTTSTAVANAETLHVVEVDSEMEAASAIQLHRGVAVEIPSDFLRNAESLRRLAANLLRLDNMPSIGVRLFGSHLVSFSQVFYETPLSFCLVNLKPIVPGHVLVLPKRCVGRFEDLEADEVGDLWSTAQKVGAVIQRHHRASSLTFAIQDGPEAGQTVKHVHIHVLPRRKLDFEVNDDVYNEIEAHERRLGMDNEDRQPRSAEAMANEAAILRELFV